jgi:hypothetical protein
LGLVASIAGLLILLCLLERRQLPERATDPPI